MRSNNSECHPAFGGYFELELNKQKINYYSSLQKFQSARLALYALLRSKNPKKVWLPSYICNAFIEPLQILQLPHDFYEINFDYSPKKIPKLGSNDLFIYVNYFGICDNIVEELISKIKPSNLILDHSQAFFSKTHPDVLATIYSPRKFFGVPDGGLIDCKEDISSMYGNDDTSIEKLSHLTKRLNDEIAGGYIDYQNSEKDLSLYRKIDFNKIRISKISNKIIDSIDIRTAENSRNRNFNHLHKRLKNLNIFNIDNCSINAPLCYPFFTKNFQLKSNLIEKNIFIPTYWQDARTRLSAKDFLDFTERLVALPIDHRYKICDMDYIAEQILINSQNEIL